MIDDYMSDYLENAIALEAERLDKIEVERLRRSIYNYLTEWLEDMD